MNWNKVSAVSNYLVSCCNNCLGKCEEPESTPPPPSYHELFLNFDDKSGLSEFEDPPPEYDTVVIESVRQYNCHEETRQSILGSSSLTKYAES